MQRFGSPQFILIRQPRPADREARFHQPGDRTIHRPRKEAEPHV